MTAPNLHETPSLSEIRLRTEQKFGVRPCLWQLKVARALLQGNQDVLCIAGTGMGKTLGFWIPLLFRVNSIQLVVTPLNLLGKQNATSLAKAGIRAIAINAETASAANFSAIKALKYRAIAVSPEQIMKPNGDFEKLLKDPLFSRYLVSIVIDEAHCITEWGEFRPEYRELGRLRYILPSNALIMITSATLTKASLTSTTRLLHMHADKMITIRRSSDRPNIKIGVKKIKHALNSYADLAFLIPTGWKVGDPPVQKFLIFFDSIPDAINATLYLRKCLPTNMQDKIKWFNADMTGGYKDAELTNLISGDTWGYCTTDSNQGMDVPDIMLIIQWRASCKLSTLWQWFGRAVRDQSLLGTALLFAEKEHFDDERQAKLARKKAWEATRKRKGDNLPTSTSKRRAVNPSNSQAGDSRALQTISNGNGNESDESDEDVIPPIDAGLQGLKDLAKDAGEPVQKYNGKRQKPSLDPSMDYLINAEKCTGLMCRRKVFDISFDNDTADSDHLDCNTEQASGCERCCLSQPTICCDIHHPDHFTQYTSHIEKPTTMPQRCRITKYEKTTKDFTFQDALDEWREQKTVEVYGWYHLNDLGPTVVMPNAMLDRIVDCVHHHKIQNILDLKKETGWTDVENFGEEVITLIKKYMPLPHPVLFTTTPLTRPGPVQPQPLAPVPAAVERRRNRCSACSLEGHNARNRVCNRHPSRSGQNKENATTLTSTLTLAQGSRTA
ncbi:P-loop containing nucleoside triphosphate hydrolase protein [Suillus paluster]|uniref:P-loop containing nucleoside triphosphate hydrolase protein n=1 Tax=Suillus paluster TaxID=48578 RepID=UPI001B87A0FB|nr:P-loop containing nucleoside triphosphate hydrolase protein [Suillus paluster]KAG1736671.1 P-loop containing nucleoside triphosphate hydrolase protein [Suillus paluster]